MRTITLMLFFISPLFANAQNIIDEVSFSENGITHLKVEGSFAKVEIEGVTGKQLHFEGELTGGNQQNIKIKYERSGSKLHVWIDRPTRLNSWGNNLKGHLKFTVPKNIELDIDNSSGAVYVNNIDAQKCRLEASSGSVNASNITAETDLETSSGRITADGIKGNLELESSSGRQVLSDIVGNIKSEATSGRIVLTNVEGRLNLRTSSGGITGEGITITGDSNFKCTSGSIKMELTKDIEHYTYKCRASSGSIYIGDRKVGKDVYYEYGDIVIEGHTSSGGQKYWSK